MEPVAFSAAPLVENTMTKETWYPQVFTAPTMHFLVIERGDDLVLATMPDSQQGPIFEQIARQFAKTLGTDELHIHGSGHLGCWRNRFTVRGFSTEYGPAGSETVTRLLTEAAARENKGPVDVVLHSTVPDNQVQVRRWQYWFS